MECLWKNAYFESRNQSDAGITAVTHVVLNRIQSDKFPDTVCEVTQQAKLNSLLPRGCIWTSMIYPMALHITMLKP